VPIAGNFNDDNDGVVTILGQETFMQVADPQIGILLFLAMSSVAVYGVMLAGWSSGSKYPLLGSVRATAQMVSYEAALGLSLAAVLLRRVAVDQRDRRRAVGLPVEPLDDRPRALRRSSLIAGTAELNRPPFDLVEAEQELVGGFHTEYSSFRFAMFFLAEFLNTVTMSAIIVTLFFGGPSGPTSASPGGCRTTCCPSSGSSLKLIVFLFMFVLFRATLPRLRYDQLMDLGWKLLIPLALGWFLLLVGVRVADDQDWNVVLVSGRRRCWRSAPACCMLSVRAARQTRSGAAGAVARRRCADGLPRRVRRHDQEVARHRHRHGAPRHHRVPRGDAPEAGALPRPPRAQPLRGRHGEVHRLRAVRRCLPRPCIYVRGADNDPDDPTSPGERFGFVYEINYLRCIHCDLCVEACPTEAITETKLFEFAFTNRAGRDLHQGRAPRRRRRPPQQLPWENWDGGFDPAQDTSGLDARHRAERRRRLRRASWPGRASSATGCVRPSSGTVEPAGGRPRAAAATPAATPVTTPARGPLRQGHGHDDPAAVAETRTVRRPRAGPGGPPLMELTVVIAARRS
jgi:NADH-quinone oxidoreductase subunit H